MPLVENWTGREAALLRRALRLSLRDFSARLGVGLRTVKSWEARQQGIAPQPAMQAILDTALRQATEDERGRFTVGLTAPQQDLEGHRHRDILSTRSTASADELVLPESWSHLDAAMTDPWRFDPSVIDHLQAQFDTIKNEDGTFGPTRTLPSTLAIARVVERSARSARSTARRLLLVFGAEVAEFAGWQFRDLGDGDRARSWQDRAMEWAQEAGDLGMPGYVLLKKAQLAYDDRDAPRMLALSQAARAEHWRVPARVRAEALQQEARAEAMLGASIDDVERKLDHARNLIERVVDRCDGEPFMGRHYTPALLHLQTAICYLEVGRPHRAVDLYDRAVLPATMSPRDRGFFLSLQATALAAGGEPDRAATTALLSARRADAVGSGRTLRELHRVRAMLSPWGMRPAVRELDSVLGPPTLNHRDRATRRRPR